MSVPAMPITCNIWHNIDYTIIFLPLPAPDIAGLPCNLQYGRRVENVQVAFPAIFMHLLVPAHTDVRGVFNQPPGSSKTDLVECPAGTQRYYFIQDVDDVSKGFAGEFRLAYMCKTANLNGLFQPWITPIP